MLNSVLIVIGYSLFEFDITLLKKRYPAYLESPSSIR
jgi:hypothetical protein